jgi:hypothetical protein
MEEEYEGGSTSLSTLMNNNPPPMETHRHMPENTVGQSGPISMRDVYDKRGGPGNYDMPPPPRQMQNLPPPQQHMQSHTQIRQPPQTREPPPVIHQPPMMRRPTPPMNINDHYRTMVRENFQSPDGKMKITRMKKNKGTIEMLKDTFLKNWRESATIFIVLVLSQMGFIRKGFTSVMPKSLSGNVLSFNILVSLVMTVFHQVLNKVVLKNFKFYAF